MSNSEPLLIVGTGALACLFAARLSAAGMPVMVLGTWKEGLEALRKDGVCLVEADGREQAFPVQVLDGSRAGKPRMYSFDVRYALVLVKSWQTRRVARQLVKRLAPYGLALTLQNGLGNREALVEQLGVERVALGVTTVGANLLGPARVRAAGNGAIALGAHPRLVPFADLLQKAGFAVEVTPDVEGLLWGKLAVNAAINPLTALLGVPNGALLERGDVRALMTAAAREASAVAEVQGIRLPYPDLVAAVESVARRTASNRSSMLQDVQRGAPTEIDAICGVIVRAGEQLGVSTPVNRLLWRLVKECVAGTIR